MANKPRDSDDDAGHASVRAGAAKGRPLRQRIADALQDAILTGRLRPGDPVVEADVASTYGVSRGPVREAMQILEARELVESVPYSGTTVRRLSRQDIEEVYSLRTALETFAVRRVVDAGSVAVVDELHRVCSIMQSAASDGDWRTVVAMDDRFHRTLIRRADHALLASAWEQLDVRVRQIMALRNLRNSDIMQIFYNHVPIVQAIAERDADAAVELLEAHIGSAADLMVDHPTSATPHAD